MPGLITECGSYKAIGQLGFAWRLIARLSVVMYSDMGRRVPAKVIPHWLSTLAGTRRSMSDCITALSLTMCWASLCECLRGRHRGSAAVSSVSCGMRKFRNAKLCETFRTACVDAPKRAILFAAWQARRMLLAHRNCLHLPTLSAKQMADLYVSCKPIAIQACLLIEVYRVRI